MDVLGFRIFKFLGVAFVSMIILHSNIKQSQAEDLTENRAHQAVINLLALGEALPDNCCPTAKLIEWKGAVKGEGDSVRGLATINHKDGRMDGYFVFRQRLNGSWAITDIMFRERGNPMMSGLWVEESIFIPVD